MTHYWKDAQSVLEHVKKATDKLYEIEITPKVKEVFPLISKLLDFAGRFSELSPDERNQVDDLCCKVEVYLIVRLFFGVADVVCESESTEGLRNFRRRVKDTRYLFEIRKISALGVVFVFPRRIEEDLIVDFKKTFEMCKFRSMTFNHVPFEIAPLISILTEVRIKLQIQKDFEKSVVALDAAGVTPHSSLTFEDLSLETPIPVFALQCISNLLRSKSVTVRILF
jgi:hypothetical protein